MEEISEQEERPRASLSWIIPLALIGLALLAWLLSYEQLVYQRQKLLDFNFAPDIAQLEVVPRLPENARYLGNHQCFAPVKSAEEERILVGHKLSTGQVWSYGDVLAPVMSYVSQHNKVPVDGVALYPDLETRKGIRNFYAMDSRTRLEKYYAGINPYTGTFFRSFRHGTAHEPGGVRVWSLQGDGKFFDDRTGLSRQGMGIHYEVLALRPQQVLFDDVCKR